MTTEDHDDALVDRLRALASLADPVPADVALSARSAIAYRDLDLRLAELVEDTPVAAGVRGGDVEVMTFEVGEALVELSVRRVGDGHRLVGQVDGVGTNEVRVVQPTAEHTCPVDDLGRFATSVLPGPVRIEFELPDGRRVATSWVVAA